MISYAPREICYGDESHEEPPVEQAPPPPKPKPAPPASKYHIKEGKVLESKYEKLMLQKEKDNNIRLAKSMNFKKGRKLTFSDNLEKEEEERQKMEAEERPPEDTLFGRRIHCWVLIKAGKRQVPKDFFIEPFTGTEILIDSDTFLGVEAVWNHQNLWSCIQSSEDGVKETKIFFFNHLFLKTVKS